MNTSTSKAIKIALGLGAIAGMRSIAAPAVLSHYLRKASKKGLSDSKLKFLRSPIFSKIIKFLAAGELVTDKSPDTPPRISKTGLAARMASGALVGAAVFEHRRKEPWQGVLIGSVSAVSAAFLTFYLRQKLHRNTKIPDVALGLTEDVIAIGSGVAVIESVD